MVNNQIYSGQNTLSATPKVRYALKRITDSEFKKVVKIRYNLQKPSESMVDLE